MSGDLSQLIPEFEPYARDLVTLAGQAGLQPRVTSTRRSYAEQKRLYDRYLAGAAQFPAAPPGRSAHEYGYAFDMVVSPFEELADVAEVWLAAGGVWHASDPIHFEYPGFSVTDFEASPVAAAVRSVSDWLAELPWYVSVLLPLETMMGERKITYSELQSLALKYFHLRI